MTDWTSIRVSQKTKEKLKKIKGNNYEERIKFLLGEDDLHDIFLTEREIRKLIKKELEKVSSY